MTNIKKIIENADNAYYATEYGEAIQLYRQALDLDSDNKHAQEQIAKAEFYRSFKNLKPEDLMAEALKLYKRSRSFIAIGDLDGAKTLLQQAINIAEKAGMDFTNAKALLENIQNATRAEEYKKKAYDELDKQQWVKAEASLSIAIDLDPTDHIVQILLPYLRSLLKAQNLALQLNSGFGSAKSRLKVDKEIQAIIKSTIEAPVLRSLWLQVLEARYQKEKSDSSDRVEVKSSEDKFTNDVFISYSHKDKEWVRSVLLPALENHGLKVCIDYRDFIAGKAAVINMQDASESSRFTLLVLTPRWVESEWTLYESILSRTGDPSGLQRRTIPLQLEKCDPPKFISILTWVDFTNKNLETEAWRSLFKSLNKKN